MFVTPTLDGAAIFGLAVRMQVVTSPSAEQITSFFGVSGLTRVFGGSRGRTIMVTGLLTGADIAALNAAESMLLSYNDRLARTLVDTRGRSWPSVVFKGEFDPDPNGPILVGNGWGLTYKAIFHGLI